MIHNYDKIIVKNNSLVNLDIYKTIIFFKHLGPNWWTQMEKKYDDDYIKSVWHDIISNDTPYMLDKIKFFNLINRINKTNSKLILLSAISKNMETITYQQLVHFGIPIEKRDFYISEQKGKTVRKLIQKYKYDNVIFVDDKIENINDVKEWNPEVKCYHIKHINL